MDGEGLGLVDGEGEGLGGENENGLGLGDVPSPPTSVYVNVFKDVLTTTE